LPLPYSPALGKASRRAGGAPGDNPHLGDLQIVVFVADDTITDPEIYEQTHFLKQAAVGLVAEFHSSEYVETPTGEGFINGIPENEWGDDEADEDNDSPES
jgi:hypothetical protein